MTVACVLRSGGAYTAGWVARLESQVARHLAPERFVCLSDVDVPCERIPLIQNWPGWWAKLEVFRGGLFEGLVLYLDLDTLVVGDLSALRSYGGRFATLRDFWSPEIMASGVMLWQAGEVPLYEWALEEPWIPPSGFGRSDPWWNQHESPEALQDLYPGVFASYKAHELADGPGGFSCISFHGQPKMSDLGGWVAEAWAA